MISRRLDERNGIIYVRSSGIWTEAEVDEHYDDLRRMIGIQRLKKQPARVLSDITTASRQRYALETYILRQIKRTFRLGDRFAVVTGKPEDKGYARMILGKADVAVFSSQLAAEMWLLRDEHLERLKLG